MTEETQKIFDLFMGNAQVMAGAITRLKAALESAPVHHTHNCYELTQDTGEVVLRSECHPYCWEINRTEALNWVKKATEHGPPSEQENQVKE